MNDPTLTMTLPPQEKKTALERPRPHLFLVLRADDLFGPVARFCLSSTFEVRIGRGGVFSAGRDAAGSAIRIALPDKLVSRSHLLLSELAGEWRVEDLNTKNGTLINGERVQMGRLRDGDIIQVGHAFFLFKVVLARQPSDLVLAADSLDLVPGVSTLSPTFEQQLQQLVSVAGAPVAIMVTGSTGTGKELIGKAVHALANRCGRFVPVNCGALSEKLVDAQLFGHIKGSFSGATDTREGLVAAADKGTLFLDEIGDLPLGAQAVLLRTLQERAITPVGATTVRSVDFQLVSATHRDLVAMQQGETFREDLFGRLKGFQVCVPDLAQRLEDVGLILRALLRKLCPDNPQAVSLTLGLAEALLNYSWPRNVRELENYLGAALALAQGQRLGVEHFPHEIQRTPEREADGDSASSSSNDGDLRTRLVTLLERHNGNVAAVARDLGKGRAQVHRYARRFNLDFDEFRDK